MSSHKKQGQFASTTVQSPGAKSSPRRVKRTIRASIKGKMLSTRTVNCYARSMHAFCRWLEVQGYVQVAPSNHVKMPKVGKPLIRIIEFDEFERMLKACAPLHEFF